MQNNFWNENADQWAQVVDSTAIASRKVTNPAIVQAICDLNIKSILDVGCGEGWLGRALPENILYMGIDGSKDLIEKAKSRSQHSFEVASYAEVQNDQWSTNKKFEAAVFNFSLLDEDINGLLKSIRKFLAPHGKLIIQTLHPCFKLPEYKDSWFSEDFSSNPIKFKGIMPWYGRTLDSWTMVFQQAGLRLYRIIEPRGSDLPTSIIFVLENEL